MAYIDNVNKVLNIQPEAAPTRVRLSQNENGRNLYFTLAGNENPIPSGVTVTISGTKPDGTVYSGIGSISNDVVLIPETVQLTAVAGVWDAKVKITSGGNTVATGRIRFLIDADTVAPGSVPSSSVLEGLVEQAQQYAETARQEAYGSPLTATTVAGMTDHTRVYVYTGSESGKTAGHWYYWNGSAWTDGGVYNSTAVQTDKNLVLSDVAADAKAVGDAIAAVTIPTDKTLTISDAPADAKVVGDELADVKSDLDKYDSPFVVASNIPAYTNGIKSIKIIANDVAIYEAYRVTTIRKNSIWHWYMDLKGYNGSSWVHVDNIESAYVEGEEYPRVETLESKYHKYTVTIDWNYVRSEDISASSLTIDLKNDIVYSPFVTALANIKTAQTNIDSLSDDVDGLTGELADVKSAVNKYDSPFVESTNNPRYTSGIVSIKLLKSSVANYQDYRIRIARHNESWHLYMELQGYDGSTWTTIGTIVNEYNAEATYPRTEEFITGNGTISVVMDWEYAGTFSDSTLDIRLKKGLIVDSTMINVLDETESVKSYTGHNLINTDNMYAGALLEDGTIGSPNTGKEEVVTDYIPVDVGASYILQIWASNVTGSAYYHRINYYDSSKSLLSTQTAGATTVRYTDYMYRRDVLIIPASCAFIRVGYRTYGDGMIQLEKGVVTTAYAPGIQALKNTYGSNNANKLPLKSIAHRGGGENGETPENTAPAFIWGKEHGFPIVETDVSWTSNGVPVLLHDASINRTARNDDGTTISTTINIADITYEQALQYDFGIYRGSQYAGIRIMKFEDFVILCRNIALMAYIEIKPSPLPSEAQIKDIVDIVKMYGMDKHVTWISSDYQCLYNVKKCDKTARLGYIRSSYNAISLMRAKSLLTDENEVFIDAYTSIIDETLVNSCKAIGLKIESYAPNTKSAMLALDTYVSGATSDRLVFADVIAESILKP